MRLPILHTQNDPTAAELIRLFHRTELHWTQLVAEQATLEVGTAFANPELSRLHDANRMLDVSLPEGMTPAEGVAEVEGHFTQQGVRCLQWTTNPAVPREQTRTIEEFLLAQGYRTSAMDIMHLGRAPVALIVESPGLTIIPARASFRHARELAEESAEPMNEPQLVEAALRRLDDPHWDALLALKDGKAVARVGVLSVGDLGRIENLFVSATHRRLGFARTMMSRALEICARSLFKQVYLTVPPDNTAAIALYAQIGFIKIGQIVSYRPPAPSGR